MSYLSAAHARLLADMPKPFELPLSPSSEDLHEFRSLIERSAKVMDEYLAALFREAEMAGAKINVSENLTIVTSGLDYSEIGSITDEAEKLEESEQEFRSDRSGFARAHAMGVD